MHAQEFQHALQTNAEPRIRIQGCGGVQLQNLFIQLSVRSFAKDTHTQNAPFCIDPDQVDCLKRKRGQKWQKLLEQMVA